MDAVLREMLLQAELHAHDPARRLIWLDAVPCLLQVQPSDIRPAREAVSARQACCDRLGGHGAGLRGQVHVRGHARRSAQSCSVPGAPGLPGLAAQREGRGLLAQQADHPVERNICVSSCFSLAREHDVQPA